MGNLGKNSKYIEKTDNLKKYLSDISKIKLLTNQEYLEIIDELKVCESVVRKKELMDKLVKNSVKFVISIAKNYQSKEHSIEDLVSEGNLGLIAATKHFDVNQTSSKFLSYANFWIIKYILKYVETNRTVRFPTAVVFNSNKIGTFARKHYARTGITPTRETFMSEGFKLSDISFFESYGSRGFNSLNETTEGSDGHHEELINFIPSDSDDSSDSDDLRQKLRDVLDFLPNRDKSILCDLYGFGSEQITVTEASTKYRLSEERVRQIRASSLVRLKNFRHLLR